MKMSRVVSIVTAGVAAVVLTVTNQAAAQVAVSQSGDTATVEVLGGTAVFEAATNISAINVHGKSTDLHGRAEVRQVGEAISIEKMEATVSVKTLATGMGLRDEHMRKHIFTTGDGQTPDLKFIAERGECSATASGVSNCKLVGQLAIRGTARPFAITLKVSKAGDAFRAAGDGTIALSAWGIARPSQLGVTTTDEVKLHLEFMAKPSHQPAASERNSR